MCNASAGQKKNKIANERIITIEFNTEFISISSLKGVKSAAILIQKFEKLKIITTIIKPIATIIKKEVKRKFLQKIICSFVIFVFLKLVNKFVNSIICIKLYILDLKIKFRNNNSVIRSLKTMKNFKILILFFNAYLYKII
jgi:hypothetical protein